MSHVFVTGATGFVGKVLCETLTHSGHRVRAAVRQDGVPPNGASEQVVVGSIGPKTDWDTALDGVEVVVHVAAMAHRMRDARANRDAYMEVNALGTQSLAEAASARGVRRFVYVSTIKVNGGDSSARPYRASDLPRPDGDYGESKWLGEQHLFAAASRCGMDAAVVRPPLVYGAGVRANFLRLMNWVDRGLPLPLGAIHNRRSLVSVWNLCDLLARLVAHGRPVGGVWMVSDDDDLSTPDLVRRIAATMNRRARLIPVPQSWLAALGTLTGKEAEIARLCGSLTVDVEATKAGLEWMPPLSVREGIARTTEWYFREHVTGER
jgi:nucleoside-diphosphate-sugar epimerase